MIKPNTYKSDARIKGGKIGICPLCQSKNQLRLSHIIPKWAYQWAKSEGNGVFNGNYYSLNFFRKEQDGTKNYILCEACEQKLGEAENYLKILMHGSEEEMKKLGIEIDNLKYSSINYKLILRALMGIIFKAHFATAAPFHNFSLEEKEIANLRDTINTGESTKDNILIIPTSFYSEKILNVDPKAIIIHRYGKMLSGSEIFTILFGGWEWVIYLKIMEAKESIEIYPYRLTKDGNLILATCDIYYRLNNSEV